MYMEILDRLLQFFGYQFLEGIIRRISHFFTKFILYCIKCSKRKDFNMNFSDLALLFKSKNFLVINKPPDIVINSNDLEKVSVHSILRDQFPELVNTSLAHDFYFPHRLDYATSGILCLALNKKACSAFCTSLETRKCKKYYVAFVNGHINEDFLTIDDKIGEDVRYENTSKKMCSENSSEAFCRNLKMSSTKLHVLQRGYYSDLEVTKIILVPITGRRHQLRVHCQNIGHPILGDYTYGLESDRKMPRMFLHAIRLQAPNEVEEILIETSDPFTQDQYPNWKPTENVGNLNEIFEIV